MNNPMISVRRLRELGACRSGVVTFQSFFNHPVSLAKVLLSDEDDEDDAKGWLVSRLLPKRNVKAQKELLKWWANRVDHVPSRLVLHNRIESVWFVCLTAGEALGDPSYIEAFVNFFIRDAKAKV